MNNTTLNSQSARNSSLPVNTHSNSTSTELLSKIEKNYDPVKGLDAKGLAESILSLPELVDGPSPSTAQTIFSQTEALLLKSGISLFELASFRKTAEKALNSLQEETRSDQAGQPSTKTYPIVEFVRNGLYKKTAADGKVTYTSQPSHESVEQRAKREQEANLLQKGKELDDKRRDAIERGEIKPRSYPSTPETSPTSQQEISPGQRQYREVVGTLQQAGEAIANPKKTIEEFSVGVEKTDVLVEINIPGKSNAGIEINSSEDGLSVALKKHKAKFDSTTLEYDNGRGLGVKGNHTDGQNGQIIVDKKLMDNKLGSLTVKLQGSETVIEARAKAMGGLLQVGADVKVSANNESQKLK